MILAFTYFLESNVILSFTLTGNNRLLFLSTISLCLTVVLFRLHSSRFYVISDAAVQVKTHDMYHPNT